MLEGAELKDQVVLVTGAGKGLGRVIAIKFAAQKAIVACHDLTPINLDETISQIKSNGGRAGEYIFDLAKKMPVQAMVEQVVADWGRIDILVNNFRVKPRVPILKMDEWDWHHTIDLNLGGPFFTMQSVGRVMKDLGGGTIVNICEEIGESLPAMELPAYCASMEGLVGLTQQAAHELADYHIRVHAVRPGINAVEEKFTTEGPSVDDREVRDLDESWQAVAARVLSLCSPAAAKLTGQIIKI
jgi:NAD(P)-dependent dehydrogenase (short-subunit alcohol dehydrogenase family)